MMFLGNEISTLKRKCMQIEDERNAKQAQEEEEQGKSTGEIARQGKIIMVINNIYDKLCNEVVVKPERLTSSQWGQGPGDGEDSRARFSKNFDY